MPLLDRMVADLEDEEEDAHAQPSVTRFDEPMSVTFGGSSASTTRIPNSDDCQSEQPLKAIPEFDHSNPVPSKQPPRATTNLMYKLTYNGGKVVDAHSGELQRLWSQTRDEVILSVMVPAGTSATELDVTFISEDNNNITQLKGTARPTLSVVLSGKPLLKGRLAYDILVQADGEHDDVDWNLEDFDASHRCVKVRSYIFSSIYISLVPCCSRRGLVQYCC